MTPTAGPVSVRTHDLYHLIRVRRHDRANAIGPAAAEALLQAVRSLAQKPGKPLVITTDPRPAAGGDIWMSGGDLKELAALSAAPAAKQYAETMASFFRACDALPVPVIVALDGRAIGGGAEVALAGDIRIATQASTLEFRQLSIGLIPGFGSVSRLIHYVGASRARWLVLAQAILSAEEARDCGLLHEVTPDRATLWQRVEAVSRSLVSVSPEALAAAKELLVQGANCPPGALRQAEHRMFERIWRNPAHTAALEKFSPQGKSP